MSTISRRYFCALVTASSVASLSSEPVASAETERAEGSFPVSDYTPFGYLDNPWHTWDLHRSGILRSIPGIGFGLYYPAGPGGYFDYKHNGIYEASLSLGFLIESRRYYAPEDFAADQLFSPYHSKNLLSYQFAAESVKVESTFLEVNEDAIGVRLVLLEQSGRSRPVRIVAIHSYRLGGSSWWGRDGLAGRFDQKTDALLMRSFAAGTCFAVAASRESSAHFVSVKEEDIAGWLGASEQTSHGTSYYPQALHGALRYELELKANSRVEIALIMARGTNADSVIAHARASITETSREIARKQAEDTAFWNGAAQLSGDWPRHWKHGWVYDCETLRMMVRRPIGVYQHQWDAMQIQAPRNVLAETSIDMWALSYMDPAIAKAGFAGQFLDALVPNVPCMREDGVMNMVAVDGSECGTSISWCFPFFCAESIFSRTHDLAWLRQLYPGLARLLRWTLAHRSDGDGFLIGKCSWETGMDASKRFLIKQPTGGELTEFMRLPELQAAASHAGAVLARFARLTGDAASVAEWEHVREIYSEKTQRLWQNDWFHDFDSQTNQFATSTARDPAQSAPAFCGIATDEQKRRMRPTLRAIFEQSRKSEQETANSWDNGLAWSSLVLPYIESVWSTGDGELASEVIADIAERIYSSMDRRTVGNWRGNSKRASLGWPGVSCEIWGRYGAFGGEGYGWGAVMPAHIIRNLLGFRETDDPERVWICPNLPAGFGAPQKRFGIRGLNYRQDRLDLEYEFIDDTRVRVRGEWSGSIQVTDVRTADGRTIEIRRTGKQWTFEAANRERCLAQLRLGSENLEK